MDNKFIRSIKIDWSKIEEDSYLRKIHSINKISELSFTNNITFFIGENGTGKSTLLEAIAVAYGFNPEGGTLNYRFSTYNDNSELSDAISISKGFKRPLSSFFFRAESFYNVATKAIEYNSLYGEKGLHEQSHGESFLSFFQAFQKEGIYIIDEPESALSMQRQLTLLIQIAEMAKRGSQFIIVTHSPILLAIPNSSIWSFDNGEIHACDYEETENFQILKMFVNNRESFIKQLLADGK